MNVKTIGSIVIAIITAVVLINVVSFIIDDSDINNGPEVGEYIDEPDAVAATGSLRIVEDSTGKNWIFCEHHGSGTVKFKDGHTKDIFVKKGVLDVLFITGQSNAGNRAADSTTAAPLPAPGMAFVYADKNGQYDERTSLEKSIRPVVDINGVCLTNDKCPAVCYEYTKKTDSRCIFVCGCIGNRAIGSFLPGNEVWEYMKNTVIPGVKGAVGDDWILNWDVDAFMWIQGEADTGRDVEYYKKSLNRILDSLQRGDLGERLGKCLAVKLSSKFGGNSVIATQQLIDECPDKIEFAADASSFTVENGNMSDKPNDSVHISQKGDNIIGKELGSIIADYGPDPKQDISKPVKQIADVIPILIIVSLMIAIVGTVLINKYQ